jgi:uroporphyrinogen-III synthase
VSRVAVTTDRFSWVAPYFARVGLEPVATPCIRMMPAQGEVLEQARMAAEAADLILLTSARTVELLWPESGMPACDVAAVGPATARAVVSAGGRVVTTGQSGLSDLVEAVADGLNRRQVVIIRAADSDPVALRRLHTLAPELEDHVVYVVQPIGPSSTPVDAVAFASPSAVEGWLLTRSLDGLVVAVIGDTTAAAVSPHRAPDVVAAQSSFLNLASALSSFMEVTS